MPQNYPSIANAQTFLNDFAINNANPAVVYAGTEASALYYEDREVSGTKYYNVQNATFNKVSQTWLPIDITKPAYAMALTSSGATQFLSANAGVSPISAWTVQSSADNAGNETVNTLTLNGVFSTNPGLVEADTIHLTKNAAYTNYPAAWVNAGIRSTVNVNYGMPSYEWAVLGVVNINSLGTGQHVGVYGQANKASNSGTTPAWGATFQVIDNTLQSTQTVGVEIDINSSGADANTARIFLDLVSYKVTNGTTPTNYCGIRLGPGFGSAANGSFINGILFNGGYVNAVNVPSTATSSGDTVTLNETSGGGTGGNTAQVRLNGTATWGLRLTGTYVTGIDLSTATNSGGTALRIKSGDLLALEATSTYGLKYDSTNTAIQAVGGPFETLGGATWKSGTGAPAYTAPAGSLFSRTDGGSGTRLYVSAGAGTWNPVAGV